MAINRINFYSVDGIDEVKTIENGKSICSQYQPLVAKRIKMILCTPMNSTSIVIFNGKSTKKNTFEKQLIERCAWNDDQVTNFINNILLLEKVDKLAGSYLKYKYIYDKPNNEIAEILKVTDRTLRNHKDRAYFQMAIWSNEIEYVYSKTFHFVIENIKL